MGMSNQNLKRSTCRTYSFPPPVSLFLVFLLRKMTLSVDASDWLSILLGGITLVAQTKKLHERSAMWRGILKVVTATTAFCGVHSLLAHRSIKRIVARCVGEEAYRGWYRTFYNVQALLCTAALFTYLLRQARP
jgi:hypothetical protein